ncbi:hypothetical protein [Virgibacillus alimentarius]|uniref:Uncharacterized protein n=1 Tax=Virgibacillus alimentarius TaxID=698769 RepID=A0ABS4S620_9BACI|nr:hypothetical protein [Virgibacillus alimentarius]MBP2256941.1 hypothetical protein [Virgibacillus alimentarius]
MKYAKQIHILKDHYGKLSADEKELVIHLVPPEHETPEDMDRRSTSSIQVTNTKI